MRNIAYAVLVAGAIGFPVFTTVAQEAGLQAENKQQLEWKNPERIADIQDDSERIRAYSVLIGQSVYDEMLKATDKVGAEPDPNVSAVNIVDVTEGLTPEDVSRLEKAATANEESIRRLQSYLDLQEDTRAILERENILPATVVGLQLSQGGVLDLLVVPSWLLK